VVFLKNLRTNSVRSSYTDDTGNYRFSGLDPNADYELHAEKEGAKSPTRTVSSFDSRKDIVLNLKIDRKNKLTPCDIPLRAAPRTYQIIETVLNTAKLFGRSI